MQLGIYFGTIQEVLPPSSDENVNKYQYEYVIDVKSKKAGTVPSRCIKSDNSGSSLFNFDDVILSVGSLVFLAFPNGDNTLGVILGSTRRYHTKQEEEGVPRWKRRFNEIVQSINDDGEYKLEHSSTLFKKGPNFNLSKSSIKLDDGGIAGQGSGSQSVEIDRVGNTITVKAGTLNINVLKGATINVTGGDVNISCLNAVVAAKKNASISALNVKVEAKVKCEVEAKAEVSVKAQVIKLNADGLPGQVITTLTQPTCYVTGIPFMGSKTVLSGS